MPNTMLRGTLALASGVSALALTAGLAAAQTATTNFINELEDAGSYLSGDFHNHTSCTDGSMSVTVTVNESLDTYGLDWFAQTGHGGGSLNRDCRFSDPEYDGSVSGSGNFWQETIGADALLGDVEFSGGNGASTRFGDEGAREMHRWQNLIEYAYPMQAAAGQIADKPAWIGIEHNAPGHEHVSMAILTEGLREGLPLTPDFTPYATGQFEYLFDRGNNDRSGGLDFEDPANNGIPLQEDQTGQAGHEYSVTSVEWLRENHRTTSYFVPAHVERQGGFVPDENRGYNVEHFRDYYNAGLLNLFAPTGQSLAYGGEFLAGHQFANGGRGTYELDRPTAGFGTYGGAGAYAGAEIAVPTRAFDGGDGEIATNAFLNGEPVSIVLPTDGEVLDEEDLNSIRDQFDAIFEGRLTEPSGSDQFDSFDTEEPIEQYVLGRPGLATMWDALLGEGRKFWIFSSSDWHNRGQFGPFEPESTLDPWPGEYNKSYAYTDTNATNYDQSVAQAILRGKRSGNVWNVHGDLIDEFYFVMCQGELCATMGQTLRVDAGGPDVQWEIRLRDPEGANFSPYTFDNPSLAQIGMSVPMNEPVLSHIDVIRGDVTGLISPDQPEYFTNVANPTVEIFGTVDNMAGEFTADGEFLVATGSIPAATISNEMYFRVRGTNIPKGTPNETDADGNPLLDDFASLIPCTAEGNGAPSGTASPTPINSSIFARAEIDAQFDPTRCPDHLPVDASGTKFIDADVEAWADLWFYSSPIFLRPFNR
ncbi:MAG: hypothetical protein ACFBSD_11030 [Paracoccaceae bacterium]